MTIAVVRLPRTYREHHGGRHLGSGQRRTTNCKGVADQQPQREADWTAGDEDFGRDGKFSHGTNTLAIR